MQLKARTRATASLSIVVPVYNEEASLQSLHERVSAVVSGITQRYEIVLVDDGSADDSPSILRRLVRTDPHVRSIHLARNFGHQAAVTAGVRYAAGDVVVIMDADLQDPPELVGEMLTRWEEGFDVVYAQRTAREKEGVFKRWTAYLYYRLLGRVTDISIPKDTGDFCLMDRRVVDLLNSLPERNRYIRGLRAWLGFRQTAVTFERPPRFAGEPKYTFTKSLRLAIDGIVSFSKTPLRIATYLGLTVSAGSFLLGLFFLLEKLLVGVPTRGWASLILVVLFLGGVQLLTIGIIGEYLSRVYDEVKQRPVFVIREDSHAAVIEGPPSRFVPGQGTAHPDRVD